MIKIFFSGIFPRSDELIRKINRFEQGKETFESLKRTFDENEKFWIDAQKYFHHISEPSLSWNDIFRPFTLNVRNIEAGPLTRYLETNTFFRRPLINGMPEKSGSLEEWRNEYGLPFVTEKNTKILLPGPVSFLKASEVKATIEENRLLEILAEIIFSEAEHFDFVEFREPFIENIEELKRAEEIYSTVSSKGYVFTNISSDRFIDFPLPYAIRTNNLRDVNDGIIVEMIDVFSTRIDNLHGGYDFQITTNESPEFLPYNIVIKKIDYLSNYLGVK